MHVLNFRLGFSSAGCQDPVKILSRCCLGHFSSDEKSNPVFFTGGMSVLARRKFVQLGAVKILSRYCQDSTNSKRKFEDPKHKFKNTGRKFWCVPMPFSHNVRTMCGTVLMS